MCSWFLHTQAIQPQKAFTKCPTCQLTPLHPFSTLSRPLLSYHVWFAMQLEQDAVYILPALTSHTRSHNRGNLFYFLRLSMPLQITVSPCYHKCFCRHALRIMCLCVSGREREANRLASHCPPSSLPPPTQIRPRWCDTYIIGSRRIISASL